MRIMVKMAKNVSRETFLAISEGLNVSRETFLGVLAGGNAEIWHNEFHVKHFMPDFEGHMSHNIVSQVL